MTPTRRESPHNRAHIGCSGYDYRDWRGRFYPENMKHAEWFAHYAGRFDCVEINNTFYNLPEASTFDAWRERAPSGFVYALKLSRYGTHMKRLKDPRSWIDNFLERAERLGEHLGPILVQLPPNWHADPDRLRGFFDTAPRTYRWAIEFRDPDWLRDDVYAILEDANAALVIHDLIDDHPRVVTADWVYVRYHGASSTTKYAGSYSHQSLTADAQRYAEWIREGREVFAFFNNDVGAQAPKNAAQLRGYVDSALDIRAPSRSQDTSASP